MVKASAFVIYVLPIVLSVSLGTAVMAETLSASDRELKFLQFGEKSSTISSSSPNSTSQLSIVGFSSEIIQNSNLEFSVKVTNSNFNCGDLYITIYDISTSEKQVLTQSGFLNQCFVENNNILPVNENYSEYLNSKKKFLVIFRGVNTEYFEPKAVKQSEELKLISDW